MEMQDIYQLNVRKKTCVQVGGGLVEFIYMECFLCDISDISGKVSYKAVAAEEAVGVWGGERCEKRTGPKASTPTITFDLHSQ